MSPITYDICRACVVYHLSMTYTLIISREGKEDLVFKNIRRWFAEPGRLKIETERREYSSIWKTIEDVKGLILHEEQDDGSN